MAFNPFIGWEREDLERELRTAQEDYAAGSSIAQAEAGDAKTVTQTNTSPIERIKQLYRALHAIDPTTYPIADITAIDRTRVTFWNQPTPTVSQ